MATKITRRELGQLALYWQRSPEQQVRTLEVIKAEDLEAVARERKLLVHNGKLVHPRDYPCKCVLPNSAARACQKALRKTYQGYEGETRNLERDTCSCPCHTYYDGRAI